MTYVLPHLINQRANIATYGIVNQKRLRKASINSHISQNLCCSYTHIDVDKDKEYNLL